MAANAAQATPIVPGQTIPPPSISTFDPTVLCPGGTCLGKPGSSVFLPQSFDLDSGNLIGTIQGAAFIDPTTGDYDFAYQVLNSRGSLDLLSSLAVAPFTTFTTDVGYTTNGSGFGPTFVNGSGIPTVVSRSADGNIVTFNFGTAVPAGQDSDVLIIKSNATSLVPGLGTPTPTPTPSVPEPASLFLIGGGLLALSQLRRKKA
jgi:hypothetical protein